MNKKIIRKIILISFILSTPLLLLSCKSNKKDDNNEDNTEIEEEYYEYWKNDGEHGLIDPYYEYPHIGLKVSNIPSNEKTIEVYYGFDRTLFYILHENDSTSSLALYIQDETDFTQSIKFTLFRKVSYYCKNKFVEDIKEVFSFEKELGWYFSDDFKYIKEENKYIDNFSINDINLESNPLGQSVSYYYDLTPVNDETISLVANIFSQEEIKKYEEKSGKTMSKEEYCYYDHATKIHGHGNGASFRIKDNKIVFIPPSS